MPGTSGTDEYDINFILPLPPKFETDLLKLTPFIPSIHGEPFFDIARNHPELWRYIPPKCPTTLPEFLSQVDEIWRIDPCGVLFAIIVKANTGPEENESQSELSVAGVAGFKRVSVENLSAEIAPLIILPAFQRTFVSTHTIGLLLRYCLNLPEEGGLGFRRVQWTASPDNPRSIKSAERMGLQKEGIMRWNAVLQKGGEGRRMEKGSKRGELPGWDTVMLAICWDDWENGGKNHVDKLIERV